jgi:hypothetical protein
MGNHERKRMRAARHEVKLSISQQISQVQFGPAYPKALEWMSGLPLYIELVQASLCTYILSPAFHLKNKILR